MCGVAGSGVSGNCVQNEICGVLGTSQSSSSCQPESQDSSVKGRRVGVPSSERDVHGWSGSDSGSISCCGSAVLSPSPEGPKEHDVAGCATDVARLEKVGPTNVKTAVPIRSAAKRHKMEECLMMHLAMECYLRPGELEKLRVMDLVPPGKCNRSQRHRSSTRPSFSISQTRPCWPRPYTGSWGCPSENQQRGNNSNLTTAMTAAANKFKLDGLGPPRPYRLRHTGQAKTLQGTGEAWTTYSNVADGRPNSRSNDTRRGEGSNKCWECSQKTTSRPRSTRPPTETTCSGPCARCRPAYVWKGVFGFFFLEVDTWERQFQGSRLGLFCCGTYLLGPNMTSEVCQIESRACIAEWIRCGFVLGFHLGTPCESFTRARDNPPGPPPLESNDHPLGLPGLRPGDQLKVLTGNLFMRFSVWLLQLALQFRVWATLENPQRSRLWICRPVQALLRRPRVSLVVTHYCFWGKPFKKATSFLAVNFTLKRLAEAKCHSTKRGICAFTGNPHVQLCGQNSQGQWLQDVQCYCQRFSGCRSRTNSNMFWTNFVTMTAAPAGSFKYGPYMLLLPGRDFFLEWKSYDGTFAVSVKLVQLMFQQQMSSHHLAKKEGSCPWSIGVLWTYLCNIGSRMYGRLSCESQACPTTFFLRTHPNMGLESPSRDFCCISEAGAVDVSTADVGSPPGQKRRELSVEHVHVPWTLEISWVFL